MKGVADVFIKHRALLYHSTEPIPVKAARQVFFPKKLCSSKQCIKETLIVATGEKMSCAPGGCGKSSQILCRNIQCKGDTAQGDAALENPTKCDFMTKNSIAAVFGFICAVLLWETSASGDTVTGGTFSNLTVTGTSSGAELCVTIRTAAFNPKKHKIEKRDGVAYVDGRKVIGTDGSVPNINEIADMEILWNGKSIPVTHDMYAPIYNAHISPGLVNVAIDEKGEFALISFECGDATRELVWLIIGKTGAWHRFIKEIGS